MYYAASCIVTPCRSPYGAQVVRVGKFKFGKIMEMRGHLMQEVELSNDLCFCYLKLHSLLFVY
jgi:hypothetical protein